MVRFIAKIVSALKPKRRWFQFSLKWLFVLIAVVAVPCTWLAWKLEHKRRERAVVWMIEQLGGEAWYDWEYEQGADDAPGPSWIRRVLGQDFFAEVILVELHYKGTVDDDLQAVASLDRLVVLNLDGTAIGDAGLAHLTHLKNLSILTLEKTNVSDAGLVHLAGLTNLRELALYKTQVTAAGAAELEKALPRCVIGGWHPNAAQ